MKKHIFLFFYCLFLLYSCWNYKEMRTITRHSPRENTGIDTLIRIDGYYYGLCGEYLCSPFILSDKGEYTGPFVRFHSHNKIISYYYEFYPKLKKGSYQVANDTLTVNTVRKYGPWSYDILKYVFVIKSDTTLERIYSSNVRVDDTIVNRDRILFRFYPYDIERFE